jgi:hypothetical protein
MVKITITIEDDIQIKNPYVEYDPKYDYRSESSTHYYDTVNEIICPKSLNPNGRCQNCGSIYSCYC